MHLAHITRTRRYCVEFFKKTSAGFIRYARMIAAFFSRNVRSSRVAMFVPSNIRESAASVTAEVKVRSSERVWSEGLNSIDVSSMFSFCFGIFPMPILCFAATTVIAWLKTRVMSTLFCWLWRGEYQRLRTEQEKKEQDVEMFFNGVKPTSERKSTR
jgi:hypothetical protein